MVKPELGAKRVCVSCSARFYDLTKSPAVCPKCGTEQPVEQPKPKRGGGNAVEEKRPKKVAVVEDEGEEAVVEDAEEEDVLEDAAELEDDAEIDGDLVVEPDADTDER